MRLWMLAGWTGLAACGGPLYEPLTAEQELMLSALTGEEEDLAREAWLHAGSVVVDQPRLLRDCPVEGTHGGLLALYDTDGDGRIGAEEASEVWHARRARDDCEEMRRARVWHALTLLYDDNGDGRLGKTERTALFADFTARCTARHAMLLDPFDADGDGALSDEELTEVRDEIRVHRREHAEMCFDGDRGPHGDRHDADDEAHHDGPRHGPDGHGNQDGLPPLVAQFDANQDGVLSDDEREAAKARIRAGELLLDPEHHRRR